MPLPLVTGLTDPPSFADLANFGSDANAFVGSLPAFRGSVNALVTALNNSGYGDLSTFMASLLNDANANEARTTLELVKQANSVDTTAGRMMAVGAFGLGSSVGLTGTETIASRGLQPGFYRYEANVVTGGPEVAARFHTLVVTQATDGRRAFLDIRAADGGDLRAWIGSNSSPSGAITWVPLFTEAGSNTNGRFTRFPDGMLICEKVSTRQLQASTASGGGFLSAAAPLGSWSAAFIDRPTMVVTARRSADGQCWAMRTTIHTATDAGNAAIARFVADGSVTDYEFNVIATGRWF